MNKKNKYDFKPLSDEILKMAIETIPREYFPLFEHQRFTKKQLNNNFIGVFKSFTTKEKNFSIAIFKGNIFKGFLLLEYMPYDSQIFEFNAYRISNFCFSGENETENKTLINLLLDELENKIIDYNITYLTISLNANIDISTSFLNCLIKKDFYYIHTLLTFKMDNEDFEKLKLYNSNANQIKIRLATRDDKDCVSDIASKSFKINRFHLDKNLGDQKCNLLHSRSAENSIIHGFADVVFVAEYNDKVVGYYSGKKINNSILDITLGHVIISAISEKARGLGAFSLMNNYMLEWFYDNTDLAEMGTYLPNIPVHKTWIKNGLSLVRGSYQLAKYCRQH